MRVAYLLGRYPAPTETFLAREMDALRDWGVEPRPIALRPGPDGPTPDAIYPPPLGQGPRRLARRPDAVVKAVALSVRRAALDPRVAASWLRHLSTAAWLVDTLAAEGIEHLHAAWANLPAHLAWLAHRLGGPGYTVAGHAEDVFVAGQRADHALLEALGVAVCNRAAEATLRRALPGLGKRLVYLPHGLPLGQWPRRSTEPGGRPLVLGVGRLVAKKGFDTLVDAAAGLEAQVMLVGDGPLAGELATRAARRGVDLALPGRLPAEGVRAALGRARLLALPSRIAAANRDGLANVLLEAMATGVPVVTTPAGSARDAVADGVSGLLVPADDVPALAAALRRLLADAALRARLAGAGRRVVEARFDVDANAAAMAAWLRGVHGDCG